MLISFSVTNFGSIRDTQTLNMLAEKNIHHLDEYYVCEVAGKRILKAALIFGANASGKTTVLAALNFLRDMVTRPSESKSNKLDFMPFMMDDESHLSDSNFEIEFIQDSEVFNYDITFNRQYIVKERLRSVTNKRIIYTRTTDVDSKLTKIKFGTKATAIEKYDLKFLSSNTLWNETVLSGFLKTNIKNKDLQIVSDWFKVYLHRLIRPNQSLTEYVIDCIESGKITKQDIIPILRQADFNISDIQVKTTTTDDIGEYIKSKGAFMAKVNDRRAKERYTIYDLKLQHQKASGESATALPFDAESTGTQRYFGLAGVLYLLIATNSCFMIDEMESSIHPELAKHFLLTFCANASNSQLLATSHNRELLNNKDIFRNDIILFTEKNSDCATELYKLSDFDTSVIRDTSNILNAYNSGRLGGFPNLKDYYINSNRYGKEE